LNSHKYSVDCSEQQACSPGFDLGISSRNSTKLQWEEFSSSKSLSFYIKSLLDNSNSKQHQGYVILKCKLKVFNLDEKSPNYGFQLLVLPPKLSFIKKSPDKSPKISINLILLDSISRLDLYTSLPKTISSLSSLNTDQASRAEVLDYTWVQDLGKKNNMDGLASGVLPGDGLGELFGPFSAVGYRTFWHSYSCWEEKEDLSSLLGMWDRFGALQRGQESQPTLEHFLTALRLAGIDDTGISSSACHLPSPSCSSSQVSLLSSSLLQSSQLSSHHQSHLSVTSLSNISTSSKQLDSHLSSYLHSMSTQPYTLTILTSMSSSSPTSPLPMFMIFPHRTRSLLPDISWQNLLTNQDRLSSLLDLHYTLLHLPFTTTTKSPGPGLPLTTTLSPTYITFHARYVPSPQGLLSELPKSRLCTDLPRSQFLCQCKPTVTTLGRGKGEGLGDVITQWWNLQNNRGDTSCARLSLVKVVKLEVSSYGQGDNFYRAVVEVVVELESEQGVEMKDKDSKIRLRGLIDQELKRGMLSIVVNEVGEMVRGKMECIQQFDTQEESRKDVGKYVVRIREGYGGRLDSLFTENGVDCLWLVVRQFEGSRVVMVQLASACLNQVEAVLDFRVGEATMAYSRGEQRVGVMQGEVIMVNVFMSKFNMVEAPIWEYVLLDIDYIDEEEE